MMMMNIWWMMLCSTRDAIARDISAAAIQSFLITFARSSIISQGNGKAKVKH